MTHLKFDALREVLPDLEELRPVLDLLLAHSEPDPDRVWAGSGALDTVGQRFVAGAVFRDSAAELVEDQRLHLVRLYGLVGEALARLEKGDRAGAAEVFLQAAALEEARDRPARAEAWADAAVRAVADGPHGPTHALALRRSARAAWRRGQLDRARQRYAEACRRARVLDDPRGAAEAAVGAGNVLEEQGRWSEAEHWYRVALEILEAGMEPGPERWQALLNLHIALRSRGALDESLPWLDRAEEAARELGDDAAEPFLANARGQLEMGRGQFAIAEAHLRRALEAARGARATVTIRLNLAEALLARDRALEAAQCVREAEREAVTAGLIGKLPEVYRLLGRIAAAEGNPDALVLFEKALEIVRQRGLPALEEALTLQAYAEAERRRGEEDAAAELARLARGRFEELGITHMRHAWMDYHGPDPDTDPGAHAGGEDDGDA